MHAQYAGVVPVDLLETEFERIGTEMTEARTRIRICDASQETAQDTLLRAFAQECQAHYKAARYSIRRQFNQGVLQGDLRRTGWTGGAGETQRCLRDGPRARSGRADQARDYGARGLREGGDPGAEESGEVVRSRTTLLSLLG